MPPDTHLEYLVDADCARRMAQAVFRYRLTQPVFIAIVGFEVLFAVVFAAVGRPGAAIVFVLLALGLPVIGWLRLPRLAATLQARGFRPGSTITSDWRSDDFVIATPTGHSVHRYDDVHGARRFGSAVTIKLRPARYLVVLPEQLVPAPALRRLAARG